MNKLITKHPLSLSSANSFFCLWSKQRCVPVPQGTIAQQLLLGGSNFLPGSKDKIPLRPPGVIVKSEWYLFFPKKSNETWVRGSQNVELQ